MYRLRSTQSSIHTPSAWSISTTMRSSGLTSMSTRKYSLSLSHSSTIDFTVFLSIIHYYYGVAAVRHAGYSVVISLGPCFFRVVAAARRAPSAEEKKGFSRKPARHSWHARGHSYQKMRNSWRAPHSSEWCKVTNISERTQIFFCFLLTVLPCRICRGRISAIPSLFAAVCHTYI